ncbi:MAG: MalY/PatB family protein [Acholeplasmataceae bacterium]|jgi:cystathionine beta-lyase
MKRFNKKVSRKNTNCVKWDLVEGNYLPFSIADSDYPTSEAIVKCLKTRASHPVYGYSFADDSYFDSIINWCQRRYHYEVKKENIIPANGVVTSLYYAINFLSDITDGVIVQTPVYNPFFSVILDNNKKIVENKLVKNDNYFTINFEELDQQLSKNKIIILCSPHNPTGRVFKYDEIKKIVELAKKHDAYILSDEIHCDIMLNNNEFISVNRFADLYHKMIVFTSVSKSFGLAGLKTSNIIIKDEKLAQEFREFLAKKYIGYGNVFGLTAVKAAYNHSEIWLEKQNKYLSNNYKILKEYFGTNYPEVGVTKSEGTFLAWLDFSFLEMPCEVMQEKLQQYGVIINEGKRYSEDCKGYIRFNFACSETQMLKGLEILGKFIDEYK